LKYTRSTIQDQKILAHELSSFDVKVAYIPDNVIFNNLRVLNTDMIFHNINFEDGRFQGIRQGTVGGYTHYLTAGEFKGETLLLANTTGHWFLPEPIRERYIYQGYSGFADWDVYKADGNYLNMSIVDYIEFMQNQERVIVLSVRDCGGYFMDEATQNGLFSLGLERSLLGARHHSYAAVFDGFDVVYEQLYDGQIYHSMEINYFLLEVSSEGSYTGDFSSVLVDFEEYSLNKRGINVVVFDKTTGELVDSVTFNLVDPFRMMMR